jgi:AcrR family transcriptional regulator
MRSGDLRPELGPKRPAGRPRSDAVHAALLHATQDLLIEVGFEKLSLEEVASRAHTAKSTIYRRWPNKSDLVVAAVADAQAHPVIPDTGSLREDLLACAGAYAARDNRSHRLLSGLLSEMVRNDTIRAAAEEKLRAPYARLFLDVLSRAVDRGLLDPSTDIATIGAIFPVFAHYRVTVEGKPVDEAFVHRIIDGVVLPLLPAGDDGVHITS